MPITPSSLVSAMTANASNDPNDLHDLLSTMLSSTSYTLTYSIPLILVSIPLTFAGAFLTLDRTRSFTSRPPPRSPGARWYAAQFTSFLRGGLGGIAIGFAFGGTTTLQFRERP